MVEFIPAGLPIVLEKTRRVALYPSKVRGVELLHPKAQSQQTQQVIPLLVGFQPMLFVFPNNSRTSRVHSETRIPGRLTRIRCSL